MEEVGTILKNGIELSFLLPCYNVAKYLGDCVNSIISECDGMSYEIIAADDASTDDTLARLNELSIAHSCLKVVANEKNSGVSVTRNRLIDMAKGKYVWFVDPDDEIIGGGCAKKMVALAKEHDLDVLIGDYYEVNEGAEISLEDLGSPNDAKFTVGDDMRVCARNQHGAIAGSVCMGIMKRQFLISNGLRFNPDVGMKEDVLFNFEKGLLKGRVGRFQYPVYLYKVRSGSATTSKGEVFQIRNVESSIATIEVYRDYEKRLGDVNNVRARIKAEAEGCLLALARIGDDSQFRRLLKRLKEQKLYPFRFRWKRLKESGSFLRKISEFMIQVPIVLAATRFLRKKIKR